MRRRTFVGVAGSLATAGVASIAGCGGGDAGTTDAPENPVDMVTEGTTYYFDPIGLYVDPGESVTFRIDSGDHSATAYTDSSVGSAERRIPDGADGWNSDTINRGGFEHTFSIEGTYDYYCIPHRNAGMVGRIVVGTPGGPAEDSPVPDGEVPDSDRIVEDGSVSFGAFDG
jgi:plastocyanin